MIVLRLEHCTGSGVYIDSDRDWFYALDNATQILVSGQRPTPEGGWYRNTIWC